MRWNEISSEDQQLILQNAAARVSIDDTTDTGSNVVSYRVSNADIVRYARGERNSVSSAQLKMAFRSNPQLRLRFDRLISKYAKFSVPLAAAAAAGETARRRDPQTGLEIEWVASTADPNSIFVRVAIPASARPASRLILRKDDDIKVIHLDDEGDDELLEVLIDRKSLEYRLLSDLDSLLWVS